ncbi:hypothetical protein V2J09_003604 [Rumex salicifolius]
MSLLPIPSPIYKPQNRFSVPTITSHKGYLCFHKPTDRIYIARHVVFNESVFPYTSKSTVFMPSPNTSISPSNSSVLLEQAVGLPRPTEMLHHPHNPVSSDPHNAPANAEPETRPTIPPSPRHTPTTTSPLRPTTPSHHSILTPSPTEAHVPSTASPKLLPYNDDLIITGTNPGLIQSFISQLHKAFALKDQGVLHYFLGLQITRTATRLQLTQESYIRDILERWLSDSDDSRSQYGYAIFHGTNLISWTSRKQRVAARSSTEAEYRSLAYTAAELIWLRQLATDLHMPITGSPMLMCDNVGAIFLSKNPVISTRSKHIALDFHFIRDQVDSGSLKIGYVSTVDQLADIFTKPLSKDKVLMLRSKLQILPHLQLAGGNK